MGRNPPLRLTKRGETVLTVLALLIMGAMFFTAMRIGLDRWDKMPAPEPTTFVPPVAMAYEPHVHTPMASRSRVLPRRPQITHHAQPLPAILLRIRECESHSNYQAQNRHSSASGAYQFIRGTWNNYRGYSQAKFAPAWVQDEKALKAYRRAGTRPWNASRRCWS